MGDVASVMPTLVVGGLLAFIPVGAPPRYPVPPVPLRELVERAGVIVVAKVEFDEARRDVVAKYLDDDGGVRDAAVVLRVERTLKGDPAVRTIRQQNSTFGCNPIRFEPGTTVLAFLEGDEPDAWQPVGRNWGVKSLPEEALFAYIARVEQALDVASIDDPAERRERETAWIIDCAADPVTRWEGAFELCPCDSFLEVRPAPTEAAQRLDAPQRARLLEALVNAPALDDGTACLESLLHDVADPRILAWLVTRLKEIQPRLDDHALLAISLLERIAARDPRPEVTTRIAEFRRLLPPPLVIPALADDPCRSPEAVAERIRLVREVVALAAKSP